MGRRKISTELKQIVQKIPEDKRNIAERLSDELVFMQSTLATLKKQIKEDGTIEDVNNGTQKFKRESSALRGYNNTLRQYSNLYKQLTDLLPKEDAGSKTTNPVYDFLKEQ